jgi:hypothetical protein
LNFLSDVMTHCHHDLWHIAIGVKRGLKMRIQTLGDSILYQVGMAIRLPVVASRKHGTQ